MKTRNGFVSNSSSSSFVVAFPNKPKNEKDVMKIMFNGQEGGINPWAHTNGLSHSQIASLVWSDFKNGKIKKATIKDVTELFESRYYYNYDSNFYDSNFKDGLNIFFNLTKKSPSFREGFMTFLIQYIIQFV